MGTTGEFPALQNAATDDKPEFPRTFGNYLLLSRLARGGMGEVFLAKHGGIAGIEKHCVVKTLRPHYTDDREYTARFIDEARVVVQLSHRNIAQVFDVGRVGGQYYLAMEFIQGRDVRLLQDTTNERGTPMTEGIALHILCEVLEALDYAHRHQDPTTGRPLNLVHRDVSPQNVMVNFEGEVKLIDFGLAASEMKAEHTQPNVVMGKLAYMAPEQARGDAVDGRVDLFAVAVMAYELFSGGRYYEGMSSHEMWTISGSGGHIPPRWGDLHPDLQDILAKGLHPDRDRRYATCADFREALEGYRFSQGYRERASNLRALIADVWPSAADQSRDLLSRFSNVKLMRQDDDEEEKSRSFALSPGFDADILPIRAPEGGVVGQIPDHDDTVVDMLPSNPHMAAPSGSFNVQVKTFADSPDTTYDLPAKKSRAGVVLVLLLLIAGAGAAAFFSGALDGVLDQEEPPPPVTAIPEDPPPPPVETKKPEPPTPPPVEEPAVDPVAKPVVDEPVEEPVAEKPKPRPKTRRVRKKPKPKPKPKPAARLGRKYNEIKKKCPASVHAPALAAFNAAKKGDKQGEVNLGKIYRGCVKR
jgi:serine/threonine-protein kinase